MSLKLNEKNRLLNQQEFAERRLKLESWPRVLFIELTQKCNAACKMCRSEGANATLPQMEFSTFQEIADQAFPQAEVIDLRGWGESLVYPHFSRALEYAASFGSILKIYTNLSVSRKLCEQLMEHNVITAVSFDAAEKTLFENLRTGCRFDLVKSNLKYLSEAAVAKGRADLVYLSVTVQGQNLSEITSIIRTASEFGIPEVKLFPIIIGENDPSHLSHHLSELISVIDESVNLAHREGVRLTFGASLDESLTISSKALKEPCLHPWSYCYVDPLGRLGFCDHLIGQAAFILSETSKDFHSAWNNDNFQRLRKQHAGGPSTIQDDFYPCRWCYGRRYIDTEDWIDASFASRRVDSEGDGPLYRITRFEGTRLPFVSGLSR